MLPPGERASGAASKMCGPPQHHRPHPHQPEPKKIRSNASRNKAQAVACKINPEKDLHNNQTYAQVPTNVAGSVVSHLARVFQLEAGDVTDEIYSEDWCEKYQDRLSVFEQAFSGDEVKGGFFTIISLLRKGNVQGLRLAATSSAKVRTVLESKVVLESKLKADKWTAFLDKFM